MAFRFRKKIRIAPGISLNISKKGISSMTIGKPGASLNIGGKNPRATIGIPGSGMSWATSLASAKKNGSADIDNNQFSGLVIHSVEYMKAPYKVRRGWSKGGGKVHYGWKYKFSFLLLWFIAAFLFAKSLPGLSLILIVIGVIRFLWKQPKVNFSIQDYLDSICRT